MTVAWFSVSIKRYSLGFIGPPYLLVSWMSLAPTSCKSSMSVRFECGYILLRFAGRCRARADQALRSSAPTFLRSPIRTLARALSPGFRITSRSFCNTSRQSQQSSGLLGLPYQVSDQPKALKWPEEDLTSTADEGAGFYLLRLGETFDDGRYVVTRKLGWGRYSTVWLVRDRKYVLDSPFTSG